jgi:hypothetical protein
MTDISPEDHDLIRRYLAGQLAAGDMNTLETRIIEDPVFRNEVELTAALKEGMRALNDRGQIQPLLANRHAFRHRVQFAVAATLGAIALGLASFLLVTRDEPATDAITETLRFEPTRGAESQADVVWQQGVETTRLDLRFDVGPAPALSYEVTIARTDSPAAPPLVSRTASTSANGDVRLALDGARLGPGYYEIRLVPEPVTADSLPVTYTLRVD